MVKARKSCGNRPHQRNDAAYCRCWTEGYAAAVGRDDWAIVERVVRRAEPDRRSADRILNSPEVMELWLNGDYAGATVAAVLLATSQTG